VTQCIKNRSGSVVAQRTTIDRTARKVGIMTALKMLPWLARRAGVSEERAAQLWVEAVRHATEQTGTVGSSEHSKLALERLHELLEIEQSTAQSGARWPYSLIMKLKRQPQDKSERSAPDAFAGSQGVGVLP